MINIPIANGSENINAEMMNEAPRQFALDISKTPEPGLRNFITPNPGDSAISIVDILRTIKSSWESGTTFPSEYSWLYCWGDSGSGKTHLLKAMLALAIEHEVSAIYLAPNDSVSWNNIEKNISNLPKAILIDDVAALTAEQQAVLFRIQIEAKEKAGVLLFITGNQSIAGLNLRDDVKSRLGWGLNFELTVLSDSQKIIAINQAAQDRGINLSPDVAPWLLSNFHRDLPSLLSLIEALDHFSLERKRAVTLPLLREFLQSNN
jgi:DnaA family protein